MIVRNLAETSKRRIHTGYAASVVGCIFSSFGLRYSLRKPPVQRALSLYGCVLYSSYLKRT
jgi:hypothetical protein